MRADATLCAGLGLLDRDGRRPAVAAVAASRRRRSGSRARRWSLYGAALYVLAAAPASARIGVGIVVANVVFAIVALAVLVAGVLPLTERGRRHDARDRRGHARPRLPAVPRSAPSGVTPREPVRGRPPQEVTACGPHRPQLHRSITQPMKGSCMTATTAIPTTTATDAFLRFAMRLDAVLSGVVGIAGAGVRAPDRRAVRHHHRDSSTRWAPSSSSTASPCSCCR